jgi:hypothetical protein
VRAAIGDPFYLIGFQLAVGGVVTVVDREADPRGRPAEIASVQAAVTTAADNDACRPKRRTFKSIRSRSRAKPWSSRCSIDETQHPAHAADVPAYCRRARLAQALNAARTEAGTL